MNQISNFFMGFVNAFRSDSSLTIPNTPSESHKQQSSFLGNGKDIVTYGSAHQSQHPLLIADGISNAEGPALDEALTAARTPRDENNDPADTAYEVPWKDATAADRTRYDDYQKLYSRFAELDPENPALKPSMRAPGAIPSLNEASDLQKAYEKAYNEKMCSSEGVQEISDPRGGRPLVVTRKAQEIAAENEKLPDNLKAEIRKKDLPMDGEVPYQPPKNWKGGELPYVIVQGRPMYIDNYGMGWKRGTSVTDGEDNEWDVQPTKKATFPQWIRDAVIQARGKSLKTHANISLTGKVTH